MYKKIEVWYVRGKKGKPHFSLRKFTNSSLAGWYYRDDHPEGTGMVFWHKAGGMFPPPTPSYIWIAGHRPSESAFD